MILIQAAVIFLNFNLKEWKSKNVHHDFQLVLSKRKLGQKGNAVKALFIGWVKDFSEVITEKKDLK